MGVEQNKLQPAFFQFIFARRNDAKILKIHTCPYSSRSPLPSSSVTYSPAGVLCNDSRPFFDLLLGSATGSLKTFT